MLYELRIYDAAPGKAQAMRERFRGHVVPKLAGHGIELIAAFVPAADDDGRMHYITRFPDEDARAAGWAAFGSDPEWKAIKAASEVDGPLLASQSVTVLQSYVPGLALA